MSARDEAIKAGVEAVIRAVDDHEVSGDEEFASIVIDAADPILRADERERYAAAIKAMNRDELVEVAWQAWIGAGVGRVRDGVVAAVDAVEPIIRAKVEERFSGWLSPEEVAGQMELVRADERAKALVLHLHKMEEFDEALDAARADMRAKAMDLPSRVELDEIGNEVTWVRYADVVALLSKEKP